ncbi:MAG: 1,4-alpha-glucan branching protein GlgB [Casimicrobium sp.]
MAELRPFERLGAHPLEQGGVRFAVWAPNARAVSVVGDFNEWNASRNALACEGNTGTWSGVIANAKLGDRYKFQVVASDGRVLPLKADPYARAAEMRPANASIVASLPPKRTLPATRVALNKRDAAISIYEVHATSWKRHPDGRFYDWDELAATLPDYVADLGFTHIELMPISEYPFDGSWGYQTLGLFAPTARLGSAEAFQRFVDTCHAKNLGVIVDWVPAHFPTDDFGLAQFNGEALYEHADPREGFHRDWNTLIYNFGRFEVRDFLVSSALYWAERFAIDGLRVDAVASMLYRDYSRKDGEWIPNKDGGRENFEAIALLKRMNEVIGTECPGAMTIAEESTSFPKVSAPTYAGGLGFHFKWNMGWMNDTLSYMKEDPVHRKYHHNKMTFGLVYAFSENFVLPLSHDEVVHGKSSILGRMPGDEWQRFSNLRAYYGFMWAHPGKKLLFMGQEFGQSSEWNYERELPWGESSHAPHAGVANLIRDLNRFYASHAAMFKLDCEAKGFEWIAVDDADQSVISWVRRDDAGNEVIAVSNFTPVPREGYRLGVASVGVWKETLNTDASVYGGSGVGNGDRAIAAEKVASHGKPFSIAVTVPPLATIYLVRQ